MTILEEASYVLWFIWQDKHTRYATLVSCIEALAGDGELHEALETARRRRRYDVIRNWSTLHCVFCLLSTYLIAQTRNETQRSRRAFKTFLKNSSRR